MLLLAIPLLFQVIFVGLILWVRAQNHRSSDRFNRTMNVVRHADAPLASLIEAQSGLRAFVLTHDPAFAKQAEHALAIVQREFDVLDEIVDDPGQQAELVSLRAEVVEFNDWLQRTLELARSGRWSDAGAAVGDGEGVRRLADLGEHIHDFLDREDQFLEAHLARVARTWRRLDELLVLGLLLLVSSSAFLATIFGRGIAARINALTENIHRLTGGRELGPEIGGHDELNDLDHAFRDMAATLDEAAVKERAYRILLERRAEELDNLNHELEQKSRENELFVYSVSHDLRSPLVNLQGFSRELEDVSHNLRDLLEDESIPESIQKRSRTLVDQDMRESLHFIQQAVSRMSAIIDALLRLSRAGRVEYRMQEVDVREVVARIADALKGSLNERKGQIEIAPLPSAWGDPTAFEQVFANLMTNAVHYLDPDRPGRIEVGSLGRQEGKNLYFVRDNGLGIPEAYHEKIFAAFQRIHKDVARGEGIGLTLVKRVIDRLHGRLWVESREGEGSTFFVALPAEPPNEPALEPDLEALEGLGSDFDLATDATAQEAAT